MLSDSFGGQLTLPAAFSHGALPIRNDFLSPHPSISPRRVGALDSRGNPQRIGNTGNGSIFQPPVSKWKIPENILWASQWNQGSNCSQQWPLQCSIYIGFSFYPCSSLLFPGITFQIKNPNRSSCLSSASQETQTTEPTVWYSYSLRKYLNPNELNGRHFILIPEFGFIHL